MTDDYQGLNRGLTFAFFLETGITDRRVAVSAFFFSQFPIPNFQSPIPKSQFLV